MNFFITNREIIANSDGSESIREDGKEHAGDNLRFGTYDIAANKFTLFPEPDTTEEITYQNLADKNADDLKGSAKFFKLVYDQMIGPAGTSTTSNDALFFIHGFNTNLNGVRNAFKTLNECYVNQTTSPVKHIIIFTWPGMHPKIPLHYWNDEKDAERSGQALARGMEKVIRFFKEFLVFAKNPACNCSIHFMAHSMGHRVLKHMILELQIKKLLIPELFGQIVLMAADIEYDIFEKEKPYNVLLDLGVRVHVYFNHEDHVLDIAKFTKNFTNRLGRYGRKRVDSTLADVYDADVSVTIEDRNADLEETLLKHWYYYTSSEVIADVIDVLNGKISKFKITVTP
jgi:esterase/lipase superfamily enzyme